MASRDDIIAFLDELLDAASFEDYCPNGLQVVGAEDVSLVACGVSANLALFERAAEAGAGLVVCHHGLFWRRQSQVIGARMKARLKALFDADMSLAAYHLPLDAHAEVGNNALICETLGLERRERFGTAAGRAIGFVGQAHAPLSRRDFVARCERAFGRAPLVLGEGREAIARVGIVSGGGAGTLAEAADRDLDALITGEPSEPAAAEAREARLLFVAGGHHATETFGVRRLGDVLADRFGVEQTFIDVPNPV